MFVADPLRLFTWEVRIAAATRLTLPYPHKVVHSCGAYVPPLNPHRLILPSSLSKVPSRQAISPASADTIANTQHRPRVRPRNQSQVPTCACLARTAVPAVTTSTGKPRRKSETRVQGLRACSACSACWERRERGGVFGGPPLAFVRCGRMGGWDEIGG